MTLENEGATAAPVATDSPAPAAEAPAAAETSTEEAGDAFDSDLRAVWQKNNPERDGTGKFVPRETPAQETTGTPDQAQTPPPEQAQPAIEPPVSWSAEMKAVFPSLPPAAQEFIAKRESEAQAKITQQGQELSQLNPIRAVIEQNLDVFERNGVSPDDGLGRLLRAERLLEQNAPAAIAEIAAAYGVDLAMFAPAANQSEAALRNHIAQLEARLNDTSARIQQREAREAETQHSTVLGEIEKFAKDKTDWAELENDVLTEITGLRAAIDGGLIQPMSHSDMLSKAYERAQRNNPTVWARIQEEQRKAEEAKRVEEAQKRADAAKRNKVVNITTQSATGKSAGSMDDTLRDTWRQANSR